MLKITSLLRSFLSGVEDYLKERRSLCRLFAPTSVYDAGYCYGYSGFCR